MQAQQTVSGRESPSLRSCRAQLDAQNADGGPAAAAPPGTAAAPRPRQPGWRSAPGWRLGRLRGRAPSSPAPRRACGPICEHHHGRPSTRTNDERQRSAIAVPAAGQFARGRRSCLLTTMDDLKHRTAPQRPGLKASRASSSARLASPRRTQQRGRWVCCFEYPIQSSQAVELPATPHHASSNSPCVVPWPFEPHLKPHFSPRASTPVGTA